MSTLSKKIDFAILISVENANPNGDPLCGNRPREDYDGYGEISDVCLKRKIRNRLIDMHESVFVQSDDHRVDEYGSLKARADGCEELKKPAMEKIPTKINLQKLRVNSGWMSEVLDRCLLLRATRFLLA